MNEQNYSNNEIKGSSKKKKYRELISEEENARLHLMLYTAIIAGVVIVIFYFCVKRYDGIAEGWHTLMGILQPIIIGFIMAYLMNPIMKFFEKRFHRLVNRTGVEMTREKQKKTNKIIRGISSVIAIIILIGIVILFLYIVIPQFVDTINDLVNNIHEKIVGVIDWVDQLTGGRFATQLESARNDQNIDNTLNKAINFVKDYLNLGDNKTMFQTLAEWGMTAGKFIVNILIGIFVAVYVLMDKEKMKCQIKKLTYCIFPAKAGNFVIDVARKADELFYGFIIGKLIDSAIIGVICYFCMLIMRMPYPVVCSFIVGITNIIPVFGPYIGAVPTVTLIFVTDPMKGIYFLIYIIVLQQIDGNLIGPKILGQSTGISSFWVVVAITIGGGLFGIPGMIIGVPLMALILYIISRIGNYFLKRRKLPVNTRLYGQLYHVDAATGAMIMKTPDQDRDKKKALHLFNVKKLKKNIDAINSKVEDKKENK